MGKLKLRKLSPASQGQFNDQVSQLISSASSLPSQDTSTGSRCAGKAGKEGPGMACGNSGALSEAPGTHTPAMFIHCSCSWKGTQSRLGTLGASKANPYSSMSFSGSLPKRNPGHPSGASLAPALGRWRPCPGVESVSRSLHRQVAFHRFCKSDSATTTPPHLLLPQFPHPSKERPLHAPSCQRQKSPPAGSFTPHF